MSVGSTLNRTSTGTRRTPRSSEPVVIFVAAVILALLPWILPYLGGYQELATRMLIWGIFALGFDILLGYTGLLSLGHAAFWGIGSYAAGLMLLHWSWSALPILVATVILVGLSSWLLGSLSLRRYGIYFTILTLAFAEMLYFAVLSPLQDITGGDNGLTGMPDAVFSLGGAFEFSLRGLNMYYFVWVFALLGVIAARRIVRSPYGMIFAAIRSNQTRAEFIGFNVRKYKIMAFVISGMYAGLAGGLYTLFQTYVPTASLHWTTSGEVVIMSIIGGLGTLFGPMVGAGVVLYLENVLSGVTRVWLLIEGLIFMSFVIFLPGGIVSGARKLWHRAGRGSGGARLGPPRPGPPWIGSDGSDPPARNRMGDGGGNGDGSTEGVK